MLHRHLATAGKPQPDGAGKVPPAARSRTRRRRGSRWSPQKADDGAISGLVSIAQDSNNRCQPCPIPPDGWPGGREANGAIFLVLLIAWTLGLVSGYTLGNFIHVLLVIALVVVFQLLSSRRSIP
jgi:hypothetical protein